MRIGDAMTRSRDRRPKPAPRTAEADAELEAKYRLLFRRVRRFTARTMPPGAEGDRTGDALHRGEALSADD